MSNLVEILVTAKNLTGPAMASVNASVDKAGKGMKILNKTAKLAGAGLAVIGIEAVKMAAKFDSEMALLQTQAGVSKDKIAGLKKGVLDLAGKVGQSPDSLAESLFHVESNFASMGITSVKALALTETAAKGATVGHADLVDVTNALTAAVASGIPGVQNFDQAMGVLNATVGSGDMKMQDLADAFGSGMVATVKGFGLNIVDVGAALATFGDNNIRGALAGNQLRQSVMALAKPIAGGAATLRSIGLQTDTLAKDMQKGGLKLALEDLVAHMKAAGISSKEQGAVITEAFGRKAGSGLNILVGQIDRFESKFPEITKGAKTFSQSWEDTKKTFAFQMKSLETGFQALMIGIGEKIIPPLQAFIGFLKEHKGATIAATEAMGGLLAVTLAFAVGLKAVAGAKLLKEGFTFLIRQAALMDAAFITAGGGIAGLKAAFASMSTGAKIGVTIAAIGALIIVMEKLNSSGAKAPDLDKMTNALGNLATSGKAAGELSKTFGANLSGLAADIDKVNGKKDGLDHFNDVMNKIFTLGMKGSNGPKKATQDLDAIDKGLASLVTGGHADQAAAALAKLNKATGEKIPTKSLDNYMAALDGTKLQTDLTAQSQGRFGDQAVAVQAQLQAQQDVVDGLVNSLQALDQVNQDSYNSETKFWDAISKGTEALKTNGRTLDVHTDKGRANRDALTAIAAGTDDYTAKLDKQGASWDKIDAVYKQGYDSLVKNAMGMGKSKQAADALAKSLLHVPPEIKVKGNITDLQSKLAKAKKDLAAAPKSKQVAIKGNISQLENALRDAQARVNALMGKSIILRATTVFTSKGKPSNVFHEGGGYATGGMAPIGQTAWVGEQGPELMQVTSRGTRILNNADSKKLAALNGIKVPGYAKGTISKAERAAIDRAKALKQAAADRAKAEHEAAAGVMGSLNISYFGRLAGAKQSSFASSVGTGAGGVGNLAQTLSQWQGQIKAATHGALESRLVKAFDRFGAAALKNEKALVAVNDKLSAAKDKLSSLKDSFAQLRDSVASSVTAYGSIAKGNTGQPGGAGAVINQLATDTATAKRFAADLAALKKKGLNSQSLSELASAGIDGGGLENAERLLGSSKGDIKEINSLEKALIAAGKAAGTTTADSMYGAGIKQAQGIVNGLAKQQAHLNAIMAKAADAMAAQLKKALGGKASGGTVGAAATGGNRWGRTLVGEYGPELADLPIGSRVHSAPDTQRMLSGGGGQPIIVHAVIQLDGRTVADQMLEPTRQLVQRVGGGDVQKVYGGRVR